MKTPPPVELTRRIGYAQRLRNANLFAMCGLLLAGLLVVVQLAVTPYTPADPTYDDPAVGTNPEVKPKKDNELAEDDPAKVSWPEAARIRLKSGDTAKVGGLPVTVSGGSADVGTFDRDAVLDAGVTGTVLRVNTGKKVVLTVDYDRFAAGFGGDYGARLNLYRLSECGETLLSDCGRGAKRVNAVNDSESRTLTARVSSGLFAVAAANSSSQGTFAATTLSPSSTWTGGGASGAFAWTYPIETQEAIGGLGPDVALSYSSQAVDGRTAVTNNQGSWIGEGFSYEPGYIERRYKTCKDDGHDDSGDQCWAYDNATMMLGGASGQLVKDGDIWRLSNDDGAKIEKLKDAENGDNSGEHWKVTTTDGTQYFFGLNRRPGWSSGKEVTDSTWTSPVFGDDSGEPCHDSTFKSSSCDQAWRWNLDYVVDPLGNAVSYIYEKETNHYARGGDTTVNGDAYTRGGYLKRIDYGQRDGQVFDSSASARVQFGVSERCLPSGGVDCDPGDLKEDTAQYWPDVPQDMECKADTKCKTTQTSPSFYTRKRLTEITTQARSGGEFKKVDSWALKHTFVTNGDGTRTLWLDSVKRTGHTTGTPITLPATELLPVQKENRVDKTGDHVSPLVRPRMATIYTDSGGLIDVTYSGEDCKPGDTPTPKSNTRRCFPMVWQPGSMDKEFTDWFHKYTVDTVVASDRVGESPDQVTKYKYSGGAGWKHAEPDGITKEKFLTWSDFRGYKKLSQLDAPGTGVETRSDYTYFRGMHGDDDGSGGTTTVDITDSEGTEHRDYNELSGQVLETTTYNGTEVIAKNIGSFWRHVTATETHDWGKLIAAFTRPQTTRSMVAMPGGTWRETRTRTEYDDTYGRVTQVDDYGDVTEAGDNTCTRSWYADNASKWMLDLEKRTEIAAVRCDATPDRSSDVLDDTRVFYDGGSYGDAPTKGLSTIGQILTKHDGTTATYLTVSETVYDKYGRPTSVTDANNVTSTTEYTDTEGRNTKVTGTNALGHKQISEQEPLRGLPVLSTDANGKKTQSGYDALGRLVSVWPAFQTVRDTSKQKPWYAYEYHIKDGVAPSVVSKRMKNDYSDYELISVAIFDGFLRQRQLQAPGPAGNRLNGDTVYDELGRESTVNSTYYAKGAPAVGDLLLVEDGDLDGQTITKYDHAGRTTAQITADSGKEKWRTTYEYEGDRTRITPPQGANGTTAITDAAGQTTELRKHHSREPLGDYDATRYEYDRGGQLTKVTDPAGNDWSYKYDQQGRKIWGDDPDAGVSTYKYDKLDRMTSATDARGITTSTVYDKLSRVESTWEGEPTSGTKLTENQWDYKDLGYLHKSAAYGEDFTFTTRNLSRNWSYAPTVTTYAVEGAAAGALAGSYRFDTGYNNDGTVASQAMPAAGDLPAVGLSYNYDSLHRVRSIAGSKTWTSSIDYTPTGLPTSIRYPLAGTTAEQTFAYEDGTNRLKQTWVDKDNAPGTLANVHYSYDDAGNIRSIIDDPSAEGSQRDAQCFDYDYAGRLTEAWSSAAGGTTAAETCAGGAQTTGVGGAAPYWQSYGFDVAGNRTSVTDRNSADPSSGVTAQYSYPTAGGDDPHQVSEVATSSDKKTSYLYDETGNTKSVDRSGDLQTIAWSATGKPDKISQGDEVTSYRYDAEGNEVLRTDSTGIVLTLPGMELREDAVTDKVECTQYVGLPGGATAVITSAGTQYQFADHNGTGLLGMDGKTGKAEHNYTDPYGNVRGTEPGSWLGRKGFVGGTANDITGYATLGARQYDPTTGKFLSADPIIDVANPLQMSPYTYSHGNPVSFSDSSGLFEQCGDGTGSGNGCGYHYSSPAYQWSYQAWQIQKDERKKHGGDSKKLDKANKILNTSMMDVIIDAGGEILLDLIGVNDVKDCVGGGDVWACVSLAMDVIPITKIFSVGKRLFKAGKKIFEAVSKFNKVYKKAKDVVDGAAKSMKAAAKSAKARISKLKMKTKGKDSKSSKADSCNSFTAKASVVMADGSSKPIAKVKVGDKVKATDAKTGKTKAQEVIALPRTGTPDDMVERELVTITVDLDSAADARISRSSDGDKLDSQLTATAGHAFWIAESSTGDEPTWAPARDLAIGSWLQTSAGTWVQVTHLAIKTVPTNTYNLNIEDNHTYYVTVGNTDLLTHNEACDVPDSGEEIDHADSFSEARDIAREKSGIGSDAVPHYGRLKDQAGNVTGMQSPDGKRGWRIDIDPENSNKGFHVNWWDYAGGKRGRGGRTGAVVIRGGTIQSYMELFSHFPKG